MSTPENAYGSNSVTFTVNGVTSNAVTLDFYYAVSTVADWNAMNDNRSAWYMLVNDLSFADGGFAPIADTGVKYFVEDDGYYIDETVALRSTTYFSGVFDGNGYTISDIRYGATGPQEPNTAFGLFTAISGTVRNFTVTNVHFISRNLSGIVSSYNIGTIENVVVHDCSLVNNYGFGAIIVRDNEGTLKNAIAYNVTMYASSLTNAQRTAVACLYHWGSALEHVYLSNIQVGVSVWDEITSGTEESYTSDKIYNDGAAESISDTGFKTEAEIKAATSYDGWDSTVWNIVDGEIPTLKHN